MGEILDDRALADLLPGTWTIAATNFPMWLTGERGEPRFTYGLVSRQPLVLSDEVAYLNAVGESKQIIGNDTWKGGEFVWRGKGILRLFTSRWTVAATSADGAVVVIRFSKSLATPAGVDILTREGATVPELRAMVAHATEEFDLTPEDFASLSWLDSSPTG